MVDTLVTLLLLEKYRAYSLPHCHIFTNPSELGHFMNIGCIPAISQAKYITYADCI